MCTVIDIRQMSTSESIFRCPDILAAYDSPTLAPLSPTPISNLSLFLSLPVCRLSKGGGYTVKKEKKISLIYKEIQMGSGAKSYMRKGFLIYEELRKYLVIYVEAVSHI